MKRYSIRTLLLLTLLFAVFIARPIRHAQMQSKARDWVAAQRGHSIFRYGYGSETEWYTTESELGVPEFFVKLFGIDVFNPIETVVFDCDELTTVEPLTGIVSLRHIHVNIEMDEGIDFTPLQKLPRLESIHFTEWSFLSDSQLSELRGLLPSVRIVSEEHLGSPL